MRFRMPLTLAPALKKKKKQQDFSVGPAIATRPGSHYILVSCPLPPLPPPAGVSHPKPLNQGAVHELAAQKDMLVAESEAYQIGKPQASSFVYCAMPTTLFLLFCLAFQSLIVLNTCINRQHKVKPYRPIKLARMQVYFY